MYCNNHAIHYHLKKSEMTEKENVTNILIKNTVI